jgi:SAM-dependent methyltransferase
MTDWSDGYVTHTDYTSHFYPQLAPMAQNFALLLSGAAPIDLAAGFTYCELGCGRGFSTALLAAANPRGRFWGVDFNPAHIVDAQQVAHNAGLANITFLEKSFAELPASDLPAFDFISLHGVWSWIGPDARAEILAFLYAKLKPGGIVYISYNALPGWAAIAPLRQLLIESRRGRPEADAAAVDESIAFAKTMRDLGAGYFKLNPLGGASLDTLDALPKNYLLHEYFNRHWTPSYHSEVVEDLKAAKLAFVCSCDVIDHIDQLTYSSDAKAFLAKVADGTARETIGDFFTNRRFRRDLFTRGLRRLNANERSERLRNQRFVLIRPPPPLPFEARFPVGAVKMGGEQFAVIIEKLGPGVLPLGALFDDPALSASGPAAIFQAVMLLVASGRVSAALPAAEEEERRASTHRFNSSILLRPTGLEARTLASPVLGSGVPVPAVDQYLLAMTRDGLPPPLAEFEAATVAHNLTLQQGGSAVVDAESRRAGMAEVWTTYCAQRLPAYRRLGLI